MSLQRFLKMREDRVRKADELRAAGIDPFPSEAHRTHYVEEILGDFDQLEGAQVTVAGRLLAKRKHGKIAFLILRDQTGDIQLFLRANLLAEPAAGDLAYAQLGGDLGSGARVLDPRSIVITSYALLGFANFPSIAIQIGGISGLAPSRRGELARLGLRAMVAGNLAAFMSASLAGMIL